MTIETASWTGNHAVADVADVCAPWYAVRVMSNRERVVASLLSARGLPVSLPLYRSRRNGTGRRKETVLFPGYLFCSFDSKVLLPVVSVPGVVHVVCRDRMPVPVDRGEMEAIRRLADAGIESEPCNYIGVGDRVRVLEGPMAGVEGILAREAGRNRIVISVSLLMRSVMVELDRAHVEGAGPGVVN